MAKKSEQKRLDLQKEKETSAEKSEVVFSEKSSQENSDYANHLKFAKFNLSQGAEQHEHK